jgi:penicillin-binding protein 1C
MGRNAAAPILFDAFDRISARRVPLPPPPAGAMTLAAADLPPPLKHWREPGDDATTGPFLKPPVVIAFPPDRSEIDRADFGGEALMLRAEGGALPLTWLVDDRPLPSDPNDRQAQWLPASAGFSKLSVIDANGRVDRVQIRLK